MPFFRSVLGDFLIALPFLVAHSLMGASNPEARPIPAMFGQPKVVETEEHAQRMGLRSEAKALLRLRDYDGIEKRVEELRASGRSYPDGLTELAAFYTGFFELTAGAGEPEYEALITNLKEWKQSKPSSVTVCVSLSRAWRAYAFKGRGSEFADAVKSEQWKLFEKRLAQARTALSSPVDFAGKCPGWHAASLRIAYAEEISRSQYEALFERAVKTFPGYRDYYLSKAYYLTPIWHGKKGEAERFAEESADRLGGAEGDILYAQIVWSLRTAKAYNNVYKEGSFSWPRTKQGFAALLRQHPHSLFIATEFCYEAIQAGDHGEARNLFETEIKDQVVTGVWGSKERFAGLRRAAYAK